MPAQGEIHACRMLDNVYFVGGKEVSVHIIDTGDGLIMIDTGYPHMRERILENIRAQGLDIGRVRIILHSHGHYDHFGSTLAYQKMSGAKTYISRIDNEIVNGHRHELSCMREELAKELQPFDCDVLLDDGDVVELGDTRIRCKLCPGHTEGVMAFFFETVDRGRRLTCAMHGGVGVNSMKLEYLNRHGLPVSLRDTFREGLHRLASEHVDVVLGNHPYQSRMDEKLARWDAGDRDAFIDPTYWPRFLADCEARFDKMIEEESAQ